MASQAPPVLINSSACAGQRILPESKHNLMPTCDAVFMCLDGQALVTGGQSPPLEHTTPGGGGQQLPVGGEGTVHQGAVVAAFTADGSHLQPKGGAASPSGPSLAQRVTMESLSQVVAARVGC